MGMLRNRHTAHRYVGGEPKHDGFGQRLLKLGPASLISLFAGGLLLILTAANALRGPKQEPPQLEWAYAYYDPHIGVDRFLVGYAWSVQTWLAILGVCFGLISYGLQEAYFHLFDWWCSRRAQSSAGLDYGRYLNAQPRAPVVYGVRGFPVFSTLRYLLLLATIAASTGYKFSITEVSTLWHEQVEPDGLYVAVDNMTQPTTADGLVSPWFMEAKLCFTYNQPLVDGKIPNSTAMRLITDALGPKLDFDKPPINITMVGFAWSNSQMNEISKAYSLGVIVSREVAAVASVTDDIGSFEMSRNESDWHRTETLGTGWPGIDDQRAVVEYRILEHGKIQIQWAPLGPWLTDDESDNTEQSVTQRITYSIHYTTAEVRRHLTDSMQGASLPMYNAVITLGENGPFPSVRRSNKFLDARSKWIDAQIADPLTTAGSGIRAIVRGIMYEWALIDNTEGEEQASLAESEERQANFKGEYIRTLHPGEYPYGSEKDVTSQRAAYFPEFEYPFLVGTRHKGVTGCYQSASATFLAIGILAVLIVILRVWIGPVALTSWTGQHVYLSQIGMISSVKNQEDLASGYHVAPTQLGRLHLRYSKVEDSESGHTGGEEAHEHLGSVDSER